MFPSQLKNLNKLPNISMLIHVSRLSHLLPVSYISLSACAILCTWCASCVYVCVCVPVPSQMMCCVSLLFVWNRINATEGQETLLASNCSFTKKQKVYLLITSWTSWTVMSCLTVFLWLQIIRPTLPYPAQFTAQVFLLSFPMFVQFTYRLTIYKLIIEVPTYCLLFPREAMDVWYILATYTEIIINLL